MSPSSTVHGGQHDTKYIYIYVTFELLLHAAFVADEIWGDMLEPARSHKMLPLSIGLYVLFFWGYVTHLSLKIYICPKNRL